MRRLVLVLTALAAAAPAAQAQPTPLVTFVRTGGFIGAIDQLTVSTDGRAMSTRGAFRLSAQRLATLQRSLQAAHFRTLRLKYRPTVPLADGYSYRVRYAGRSVLVEEAPRRRLG